MSMVLLANSCDRSIILQTPRYYVFRRLYIQLASFVR